MSAGGKPLTGGKVLAMLLGAFGVIIAANLAMLVAATGSFPGLVVENSYVASQGWDARTAAQRALGWTATVGHDGETLSVAITGAEGEPVRGLDVTAVVGRPASGAEDEALAMAEDVDGYVAPAPLGPGRWRVDVTARNGGAERFTAKAELLVPEKEGAR